MTNSHLPQLLGQWSRMWKASEPVLLTYLVFLQGGVSHGRPTFQSFAIPSGLCRGRGCGARVCRRMAAWATQIKITEVAGFPNERTFNDPPANAIDGDIRRHNEPRS